MENLRQVAQMAEAMNRAVNMLCWLSNGYAACQEIDELTARYASIARDALNKGLQCIYASIPEPAKSANLLEERAIWKVIEWLCDLDSTEPAKFKNLLEERVMRKATEWLHDQNNITIWSQHPGQQEFLRLYGGAFCELNIINQE